MSNPESGEGAKTPQEIFAEFVESRCFTTSPEFPDIKQGRYAIDTLGFDEVIFESQPADIFQGSPHSEEILSITLNFQGEQGAWIGLYDRGWYMGGFGAGEDFDDGYAPDDLPLAQQLVEKLAQVELTPITE